MTARRDYDPALLASAHERAQRYLDGLGERPVFPGPDAVAGLDALDVQLPAGPREPAATLALLDEIAGPATVATMGPRYFGFVTGSVVPGALAASWLASAWDQNGALGVMSPAAARLERIAIGWLADLFELPPGSGGSFVTGATMANFTGLVAGRDRVLNRAGWDVAADGLFGAPPITVLVGDEAHSTIAKSLSLAGLGRDRVVRMAADDQGRVRADALPAIDGPTIVILQAGNVNSGAADPFAELIPAARQAGAWVHVDGAFGLWAAVSPELRRLVTGVQEADSWAVDGHKWLNTPYDCGIAMLRDPSALVPSMNAAAAYLTDPAVAEPMHRTPESSQRARGIEVWAALHSLGRSGVVELIERCHHLAGRAADRLADEGFAVLNDVVLNQVIVRVGDDGETEAFLAALEADGTCWCGGTTWRGTRAVRISVSGWSTTGADVDATVAAFVRARRAGGLPRLSVDQA